MSEGELRSQNLKGILLMILATAFWVCMNAMIKEVADDYHVAQILFFRNIIILPVLIPFLIHAGGFHVLKTKRPLGHIARSVCGLISMTGLIIGLAHMPLSDAVVLTFVAPLFITLLGGLALGEGVGFRRWAAVIVGFVGVIVMVDPTGEFRWPALVLLVSAFCFSLTVLIARKLSTTEPSAVTVFYFALFSVFASSCFLPWVWIEPLKPEHWYLFIGMGIFGAMTQLSLVAAIRAAPISVTAPFDYTSLIMAAMLDLVIWSVVPGARTWIGGLIIVAAGLYIAYREHQLHKKNQESALMPPEL